jgi:hypothetical protein
MQIDKPIAICDFGSEWGVRFQVGKALILGRLREAIANIKG